jgi:hypothetical protein
MKNGAANEKRFWWNRSRRVRPFTRDWLYRQDDFARHRNKVER